jgi:FMN-binding domain
MRRVVMALLGTALGTALLVGLKAQGAAPPGIVADAPLDPSAGANGRGQPMPSGSETTPGPHATATITGKPPTPSATRTLVGNPYPAKRYGDVQVQVIITGAHIDDVQVLQMSNRPYNAASILRREALHKQSANLTNVSGATYTCHAYMQSLQSALNKA